MMVRTLEELKTSYEARSGAGAAEGPLRVFYNSPDRGSGPPSYHFARWWGKGRGFEGLTAVQAEALLAEEALVREWLGEE